MMDAKTPPRRGSGKQKIPENELEMELGVIRKRIPERRRIHRLLPVETGCD